jgi:glucan biosynthesis protein C
VPRKDEFEDNGTCWIRAYRKNRNEISPKVLGNMTKQSRLFFIGNIRWLMIILVVMVHAAVTYSSMGSWYYTEPAKLDIFSLAFFGIFQSFTQAYSMGLLFLIAGYFMPGSGFI